CASPHEYSNYRHSLDVW
nr:immunoglobulin heavy chain junction region [Macaca mulatta]MOV87933.1 immunoglobulin heavy chain junction region [Macaca mulatta]MOV88035.1 immunoglobulin heavy chain junction region [Macaca mulatta]MOV88652.1 immunoglobulin heavy chain junction region [Macaca mulatta]MOV89510.1 immunoglobulin heavy chain junction region [Macaca mulatta]